MSYLRNAWYPAAWSEELGDEPLARTFLDELVVLYRDSAGEPAALKDMCAHRFVESRQNPGGPHSMPVSWFGIRPERGLCP